MNTDAPAEATRGDALNVLSLLVVVALCLSLALYAGFRFTRVDPRALLTRVGGRVVVPAAARAPVAPARANVLQPLVLPGDATPSEVISHGDRGAPKVALTFDAEMTPQMVQDLQAGRVRRFVNDGVIAALRDLKVPATFFLSGLWMDRYPDVARDLGADPLFELGSHGYSDRAYRAACFNLPPIDLARAADDLARNQTMLEGVTSQPTRFFRFPGGCYDAPALAAVRPAGLQVVQYDVVSGDAFASDPARVATDTVAAAQDGSIVVLHVTGGNVAAVTDRALPTIVRQLRARGFTLVRVSDLLQGTAGSR